MTAEEAEDAELLELCLAMDTMFPAADEEEELAVALPPTSSQ